MSNAALITPRMKTTPKNEDKLQTENDPNNEDNLKYEDYLKNEVDLKN